MVARIDEDGTPDSTFGTDGVASADFSSCCQYAGTVIQQMDGKLVLAGGIGGQEDIALARFSANGTLDASFGSGGKVSLDIAGSHDGVAGVISNLAARTSHSRLRDRGWELPNSYSQGSTPTERSTRLSAVAA